MKQKILIPEERNWKNRYQHGGSLLKNKRKSARPISTKKPMHFVLRSNRARGSLSFLKNKRHKEIDTIIRRQAQLFGIKIYQTAVNSNHIHILIRIKNRYLWKKWIKAVSGLVARFILNRERGHVQPKIQFWDARPWSRIVEWGKAFTSVSKYVRQNFLEAWGFIPYRPRGLKLCMESG